MFEYFPANNLFLPNQSGFKPSDSCINQLLSITHEMYQSFDNDVEVWGVFLDTLKTFNNYDSLIFKISHHRITGNIFQFVKRFLK